jgi:hypothetical protein
MYAAVRVFLFLTVVAIGWGVAAQDYQVITITNPGTIVGSVRWSGPMPHLASLPINKDSQICDPESQKTRDLERLIVNPAGGVANTVVYLKNIYSGKPLQIPEQRRFLDQRHCRYEPHIVLVPSNGTLQMKSSDAVLHTIHMDGAASFNLTFPSPNQVISRVMHTPGLVNVKCNAGHTWMNAEIMVTPNPYYTVTDESGNFELTYVPPGEYEIVAWHEGWKVERQEISFDVLTERRVQRPIFSEPKTWQKRVVVNSHATSEVDFVISEK